MLFMDPIASFVSKLLMHKFKWLNDKGIFSTHLCFTFEHLGHMFMLVCAFVCIKTQKILSPRYLAKTFLIVTKCQSCVNLCKVCAKFSSVVIV